MTAVTYTVRAIAQRSRSIFEFNIDALSCSHARDKITKSLEGVRILSVVKNHEPEEDAPETPEVPDEDRDLVPISLTWALTATLILSATAALLLLVMSWTI